MAKTLTTAVDALLAGQHVPYLMLVEILTSPPMRVCNATYSVSWNGHTWLGAGAVGRISPIEETAQQQMQGISLQLSGVPPENLSLALGSNTQGKAVRVWLAPVDTNYNMLADPVLVFGGRVDLMDIDIGETATITVTAESRLTDWNRPRPGRYTHEDQQARYPGDNGLRFVSATVEKDIRWGW
ncbi:MAG: hypothetical protein ACRCVK_19755 [Aeromonas veronii]